MTEVAVVVDHEVGHPARDFRIDLCLDARVHLTPLDAVALHDARNALFERSNHKYGLIHESTIPGFKQQRHDVNDELIRTRMLLAFLRQTPHERVHDRVKTLALRWIFEDDFRKRVAIELAAAHDARPRTRNRHEPVGVRCDGLARKYVGIDNKGA